MKIWIDLDGVISSFTQNLVSVANNIWPGRLPEDFMPSDYAYTGVFTSADWDTVWNEINTIPNFWLRQRPIEPNVSVLRTWLQTTDHTVLYLTSRRGTGGASAISQTMAWLKKHGLWTAGTNLIVVPKAKEKKKFIEGSKIDIGIDDLPATVAEANEIPGHSCYLLSQPWNTDSTLPRVQSLQEFLEIADSVSHFSGK